MPAPPPKKSGSAWRVLSILLGLALLGLLGLLVLTTLLPRSGFSFLRITNKVGLLRIEGVISQGEARAYLRRP
jgi:hypothetical protein